MEGSWKEGGRGGGQLELEGRKVTMEHRVAGSWSERRQGGG